MAARTETRAESTTEGSDAPAIAVCEAAPGTAVFIEDGNRDGWIASDLTVAIDR